MHFDVSIIGSAGECVMMVSRLGGSGKGIDAPVGRSISKPVVGDV